MIIHFFGKKGLQKVHFSVIGLHPGLHQACGRQHALSCRHLAPQEGEVYKEGKLILLSVGLEVLRSGFLASWGNNTNSTVLLLQAWMLQKNNDNYVCGSDDQ